MRWPMARRRRGPCDSLPARISFIAQVTQGNAVARDDACARTGRRLSLPAAAGVTARGGAGRARGGAARANRPAGLDRIVARWVLRHVAGGEIGVPRSPAQSSDSPVPGLEGASRAAAGFLLGRVDRYEAGIPR